MPGSANGDRLTTSGQLAARASAQQRRTAFYIADTGNFLVRKIAIGSGLVSTLAGSGSFGSVDANGTSASFGIEVNGARLTAKQRFQVK